jgi:hypothetical protein
MSSTDPAEKPINQGGGGNAPEPEPEEEPDPNAVGAEKPINQ